MFALLRSQELGNVVPLRTVLEDPKEFEACVKAEGFKTPEAWAQSHANVSRVAFLTSWVLQQPESEESVFSDDSGENDFSDDFTESGSFSDDGWQSGSETDEDFDPDGESSDSFIDESE